MMMDIFWCILIFEVVGYYGHRILHTAPLYKYHKVAVHRVEVLKGKNMERKKLGGDIFSTIF